MPTIFDTAKEACRLLFIVLFALATTNFVSYLLWGIYVWPVLYKDEERTILVDFTFGWIDAREL